MAWGDVFKNAWNQATETAKEAASAVATGARWVGKQSKAAFEYSQAVAKKTAATAMRAAKDAVNATVDAAEAAYDWGKERAVETYEWGKDSAVEAAEWTAEKAVEAYQWGKEKVVDAYEWGKAMTQRAIAATQGMVRDGMRSVADAGFDALARAHDGIATLAERAQNAYDKVREWLTGKRPDRSQQDCCPDADSDVGADGHFMAPGEDGNCTTLAGDATAAQARSRTTPSQSPCCEQRRAAGEPTRDIVYVNGINTTRKDHCRTLHAIAEQTCGNVTGIYNATEGFLGDAVQTGQDRRLIKAANEGRAPRAHDGRNPAVDQLSDYLYDEISAGRSPEVFAHSQGGAVTSLALYDAQASLGMQPDLYPEPLVDVRVTSMGAAAPFWPDGPTYEHYVHVNDATPSAFGLGHRGDEDGERAGRNASVIRFSGDPTDNRPFEVRNPMLEVAPSLAANHGVEDSYLRMRHQHGGGCP